MASQMLRYFIACFIVTILYSTSEVNGGFLGGYTQWKNGDPDTQVIADEVKGQVEAECNCEFSEFKVLKYKSQVVAGTNYDMKIQVDDNGKEIEILVYQPLPYTGKPPEVTAVKLDL